MRKLAFALAAVPLLLAAGAVPTGAADTTRVRLVYLSPDSALGAVDFYVDGRRALNRALYDTESTYLAVGSGQHTFEVRKAGSPPTSAPEAQVQQSLDAGYFSVFVGGKVGSQTCPVKAVIFSDDFATPPAGKVAARFVHMAPEVPGVDVILNNSSGTVLFKNVACFQGSSYSTFPTDRYPVALVATGTTSPQLFQTDANLSRAGVVYTLVGAGGVNQPVSLVSILDAASAGNAPQGAAATGEGGTALGGIPPLGLVAGSLLLCALLLLFVRRSPA
jgi:Domain of unknown function (DUF4397)